MMRCLTILGSTGTIGVNTLRVVAQYPDLFSVFALTANQNLERLFQQCVTFRPRYAVILNEQKAQQLQGRLQAQKIDTVVLSGEHHLIEVASDNKVDMVMAGIVGAAGLRPSLAAAQAGKRVLLANKESLVMSGQLFMDAVRHNNAELLPIDSEHNAIFQCLPPSFQTQAHIQHVRKLLLTSSGGPFRTLPQEQFSSITVEQACAHPNWVMGKKISVDSATMMNKGLEVIEAFWLFAIPANQIEVVVHPQSIVHSMVEYEDGSVLAQLASPDMRIPIAYGLAYPHRLDAGVPALNFYQMKDLTFEAPDLSRFPCLKLAYHALKVGQTAPVILNASNEIAVEAFLSHQIKFTDIPVIIEAALNTLTLDEPHSLEIILAADLKARQFSLEYIRQLQ